MTRRAPCGVSLRHWQPALGVLMETEIWPNLQHAPPRRGVPDGAGQCPTVGPQPAARQALRRPAAPGRTQRLRLVLAQTEADAERLRASGAPKVQVAGNLKFDMQPSMPRCWRVADSGAMLLQRPVLLVAVSREGEEALLLAAWQAGARPQPLLLIVPRHPQRFDEVAGLLGAAGLTLRSPQQLA